MKQLKLLLLIFACVCMAQVISSCCSRNDITSVSGFTFFFSDNEYIEKIELIGANKTVEFNSSRASITLNPADTSSSFRILYNGGEGIVTLSYTREPRYIHNACSDDDLIIVYDTHVSSTTFANIEITKGDFGGVYAKITR
jgi:hypothetical protein